MKIVQWLPSIIDWRDGRNTPNSAMSMIAALCLANRKSVLGLGDRMVAGGYAAALASVAFACNPVPWVALVLLVVSGCGTLIVVTSSNILLQSLAPDNLREQVMALYSMCFIGILPLASLVTDCISQKIELFYLFCK